jgi:hypothetical protein
MAEAFVVTVVGMPRTEKGAKDFIGLAFGIPIPNKQGNRCSSCFAFEDTGKDLHLVRLLSRRIRGAPSPLPSFHVVLKILRR